MTQFVCQTPTGFSSPQGSEALRRKLYSTLLQENIFSDCASDGQTLFDYLAQRSYAVVLLDFSLPFAEPAGVLDRIRDLPVSERPVVIAMMGEDESQTIDLDIVQVILRRPFNAGHVAEIVESCQRAMSARARRNAETSDEARPRALSSLCRNR